MVNSRCFSGFFTSTISKYAICELTPIMTVLDLESLTLESIEFAARSLDSVLYPPTRQKVSPYSTVAAPSSVSEANMVAIRLTFQKSPTLTWFPSVSLKDAASCHRQLRGSPRAWAGTWPVAWPDRSSARTAAPRGPRSASPSPA